MFSFGIFSFFAAKIAVRKRGLEFGSPPPMRAAMVISRMIRVKALPRITPKKLVPAMPERRYRILFVASHPVQYQAPLFRRMAKQSSLDLHVAYCTLRGAVAGHDMEFGTSIQWDVPLLNGYSWTHVLNRGSGAESFFGLFNPGLW